MEKLLAWLMLMSTPALASDKEAESSLNAAAVILVYRTECEKTERTADLFRKYQIETAEKSDVSEDEALKLIILRSFEISDNIHQKNLAEISCSTLHVALEESIVSPKKPSYDEIMFQKRLNLFIDSSIVGAIGAAIGFLVGFVGKLTTGRNLNAKPWWLMGWVLGSIIAVRAFLNAF